MQQALAQDPVDVDVDKLVVKMTLIACAAAGAGCPLPPRRAVARDHCIGSFAAWFPPPPVESYRPPASFAELGLYYYTPTTLLKDAGLVSGVSEGV